jgi:hypothetical protein
MEYVEGHPRYEDPEVAARRLVEIAHGVVEVPDGQIQIEKIKLPFLFQDRARPSECIAGLNFAIERGWLWMHDSGTYVKITPAGAELFA